MEKTPINLLLASLLLVCSLSADIGPPTATYTATASAGGNILDFTVANNTNQDFYFFGVLLPANDIIGSPGTFVPNFVSTFNNTGFGGSNVTYNNNWFDVSFVTAPPGTVTSGFDVFVAGPAPTSVNWFAYSDALGAYPPYTGGGNFDGDLLPGFEGTAQLSGAATPEPSYLAVAAGIVGLIAFRKFRIFKRQQSR